METLYRLLIFSLPFIVSIVTYIWLIKKTRQTPGKVSRIISFIIIAAGLLFTAWQFYLYYDIAGRDDSFNFKVIFFNILFYVAIAIVLAFGTPEEKDPPPPTLN